MAFLLVFRPVKKLSRLKRCILCKVRHLMQLPDLAVMTLQSLLPQKFARLLFLYY